MEKYSPGISGRTQAVYAQYLSPPAFLAIAVKSWMLMELRLMPS